jgi:hypothetical protein
VVLHDGCASLFWAIATTGVAEGFAQISHVSRSLIEFQVRVHRRGAEDTEAAQRPDSRTLRTICGLGASAVKSRLQISTRPKA